MTPAVIAGVLRHANPSGGVSSACRSLGWRESPPLGRGEVSVQGGEAPTSQTTSVKNSENGWVVAEVFCVLGTTVPGLVCWSHANR